MADTSGQADIRGIDIDKLAKGFADEQFILKKFVTVSKTKAREIRWYQKTAGILDSTDTTGITASQIANTSDGSLPVVAEDSWTRNTSYVRKYFVESPTISMEDIKDSDIDVLARNVKSLVRAVSNQVEQRIITILGDSLGTGGNAQTAAATGTGWDDTTSGDPIKDIMLAKSNIRTFSYNAEGIVLYMNQVDHSNLLQFLITVKGSSIPSFSSKKVESGVVMEILGTRVVVSNNMTSDTVICFVPKEACTWKSFMPIRSVVMDDPGIGKKIRVWEEGEAILTDPKAVHVITDTIT